jgi:hypothetical protein
MTGRALVAVEEITPVKNVKDEPCKKLGMEREPHALIIYSRATLLPALKSPLENPPLFCPLRIFDYINQLTH